MAVIQGHLTPLPGLEQSQAVAQGPLPQQSHLCTWQVRLMFARMGLPGTFRDAHKHGQGGQRKMTLGVGFRVRPWKPPVPALSMATPEL